MTKRFLVTGACGFIGSHLVKRILDDGNEVLGIDNLSGGKNNNLNFLESHPKKALYTFLEGDIKDADFCLEATRNIDFILHQAALISVTESIEKPHIYQNNNVSGTLNLLTAAKTHHISRFVLASSAAVYGDNKNLPLLESETPRPLSPYALNKLSCEHYCSFFHSHHQLPVVLLRYFNVYGPKQNPHSPYAGVISKFIKACLSNEDIHIFGPGLQTRDFIYIDDVVKANLNSCKPDNKISGEIINIGSNSQITVLDLAKQIITLTKSASTIHFLDAREGDIVHSRSNNSKMKTFLNLSETKPVAEGLMETIQWLQDAKVSA
ncbi:MAG: nucleoside-diphosphate-sugar epimerase [Candidatus Marinamargulisbacteria bacterium]|jgi:nucleoside-diphosphate-sugar epimerase